jgi:hypothetical protein
MKMTASRIVKTLGVQYTVVENAIIRTFNAPHVRYGEMYEIADLKPALMEVIEAQIDRNRARVEKWENVKEQLEAYAESTGSAGTA